MLNNLIVYFTVFASFWDLQFYFDSLKRKLDLFTMKYVN